MAVDYDLVIVGASEAGETAAIAAASCYGRVAWILESAFTPNWIELFAQLAQLKQAGSSRQDCQLAMPWLLAQWQARHSLAEMQARGVDILEAPFHFQTVPSLCVEVGQQRLRSHSYLLADPYCHFPAENAVTQLRKILGDRSPEQWPNQMTILGNSPQAVSLSENLRHLGCQVLLSLESRSLLPSEDPDLVLWLHRHLEAQGILLDTTATVPNLPSGQDTITIRFNPQSKRLGLEDLGVDLKNGQMLLKQSLKPLNLRWGASGLWVDRFLRTSHPQVYGCGSLLGGYSIETLARTEATLAAKNALFPQKTPIHYHKIPYQIAPEAARVGLTEPQAIAYDPTLCVVQYPTLTSEALSDRSPALKFSKVLVTPQGRILGVHLGGEAAMELSYIFAIAMQQGATLESLAIHPLIRPIVAQWQSMVRKPERDRWERRFYRQRRSR
jgi:pyruvate/2-oxoglutarate dehydrogenase complex dihydrolipoamide dehydrogenase (E3) component